MLAAISLASGYKFCKTPPEEFEPIRQFLLRLIPDDYYLKQPDLAEPNEHGNWRNMHISGECIIDLEVEGRQLVELGVEFTIRRFDGCMYVGDKPVMTEKVQQVTNIQIAVADIGVMLIQAVRVLNDCCTDALQKELDDGWRIIAVCPPREQRRPDYVLGHKDASMNSRGRR